MNLLWCSKPITHGLKSVTLNASSATECGGSGDHFHCAAENDTWCLTCDYVDPLSSSPQVEKAAVVEEEDQERWRERRVLRRFWLSLWSEFSYCTPRIRWEVCLVKCFGENKYTCSFPNHLSKDKADIFPEQISRWKQIPCNRQNQLRVCPSLSYFPSLSGASAPSHLVPTMLQIFKSDSKQTTTCVFMAMRDHFTQCNTLAHNSF